MPPTTSALQPTFRTRLLALGFALGLPLSACGSSSHSGNDPCAQLCACVQDEGGAQSGSACRADCQELRNEQASEEECRDVTADQGFPQCRDACAGFPSEAGDDGAGSNGFASGTGGGSGTNGSTGSTGSSGTNTGGVTNTGGTDGSANGVEIPEDPTDPPYLNCDVDSARAALGPAGQQWSGVPPWTQDQLNACMSVCPDGSFTCFETQCTNGADFNACFTGELGYCAVDAPNAPCSPDFDSLACCVEEYGCASDQNTFDACIAPGGPCSADLQAYVDCSSQSRSCQNQALDRCVAQ